MAKRALLIGCNYPGSDMELRGCINDVMGQKKLLTSMYGFDEADIIIMIDTDESYEQPTGKNIKVTTHSATRIVPSCSIGAVARGSYAIGWVQSIDQLWSFSSPSTL